jgi:hypothetical protein
MSDVGFDITAYKLAAQRSTHELICFLNTFSRIEADNWLRNLYDATSLPSVGMVGATASFESVGQSMRLMNRAVWYCCQGAKYDSRHAAAWREEISQHAPQWLERGPRRLALTLFRKFVLQKPYPTLEALNQSFEEVWKPHAETYDRFPGFPNPHIRSNAFMMPREQFLELTPNDMATKDECYEFESGYTSLSRKVATRGLSNVVVGADGVVYPQQMWALSCTFRQGKQLNKLVSDNQTRDYDEMSVHRRKILEQWTWGDGKAAPVAAPATQQINQLPNPHDPLPFGPGFFA